MTVREAINQDQDYLLRLEPEYFSYGRQLLKELQKHATEEYTFKLFEECYIKALK